MELGFSLNPVARITHMHELRRYRRLKIPLLVEIRHPKIGKLELPAADMSDGGVFLVVDECFQPDIDESVIVRTLGLGPAGDETGPPLVMTVVRKSQDGIGLSLDSTASANLESLSADDAPKSTVLQNLFIVNSQNRVLFVMQGERWRLPARELAANDTWQHGLQTILKELQSAGILESINSISVKNNCYPHAQKDSPLVDLVIPALLVDSKKIEPEEQDALVNSIVSLDKQTYRWFLRAEINELNCMLDANLVDNILGQV